MWIKIDYGIAPNADLTAITQDMPISCRDNAFNTFIDHIVFDARSIMWVERSSFRQMTYRQADKAVWGQISDHCPVMVEMWIE